MLFQVSVGIPVYNGQEFIEKAVKSAVHLDEVEEVVIVEDGSTDNTLAICKQLEQKYQKVRLLRHPGGANKGLPASRNLAVRESRFEYVAFLDADDFYLPHRFQVTRQVFEEHPDADGVYESLGTYFYSERGKDLFFKRFPYLKGNHLTSMKPGIPYQRLFHHLVFKNAGELMCQTLTLKKSLLRKSGYFNEKLRLHGDNEAFLRFAYHGRLYPGNLKEPVAMRGVHGHNRCTTDLSIKKRSLWNEAVFSYFADKDISKKEAGVILRTTLGGHYLKHRRFMVIKYLSYLLVISYVFAKHPAGFVKILRRALF